MASRCGPRRPRPRTRAWQHSSGTGPTPVPGLRALTCREYEILHLLISLDIRSTPATPERQQISSGTKRRRMAAGEIATLVTDATPCLTAALTAYGTAVLTKVRDDAADATVGVGRRLLQRVFGSRKEGESPPALLTDVVMAPDDPDALGALRLAIRRALEEDTEMLADVRQILADSQTTIHA